MSNADELLKLKELLESGLLSEEEFSIEKNKILNRKDDLINTNLEKTNYKTPNIKCNSKKTNLMLRVFCKKQGYDYDEVCERLERLGKDV